MLDLKKTLKIAEKICYKAGYYLKEEQSQVKIQKYKGDRDFATMQDITSEKIIIDELLARFPNHGILSEEKGRINPRADYQWIVDPLDGTQEYFRRMPHYAVILALEQQKKLILGVVYFPVTNRLFSCVSGLGSFNNNYKIKVSTNKNLKKAFVFCHLPDSRATPLFFKKNWLLVQNITFKVDRLRVREHDIENLCLVAAGSIEAALVKPENNRWGPKWWDVAPGILMVKEAGGTVTDFLGKEIKNQDLSYGLVASNGLIHQELLEILKGQALRRCKA